MNQPNENFRLPPSPTLPDPVTDQVNLTTDNTPSLTPLQDPEQTPEQIETAAVNEIQKVYRLTPKFNEWCRLFFDKENKDTYGNKTQSALRAYSLDPETQYHVGGQIGYENYKKLENVASIFADRKGHTFEKMIDHAYLKFLKSDSPEWWDRLMDYFGYRDMKPTTVVQNNTQNNTLIAVPDGEKKSFNDQFRDFIKAR